MHHAYITMISPPWGAHWKQSGLLFVSVLFNNNEFTTSTQVTVDHITYDSFLIWKNNTETSNANWYLERDIQRKERNYDKMW